MDKYLSVKLPPQNLDAEKSLIGCLLIDVNAISKIADFLTPSDFYNPNHKRIYEVALELFEQGDPIDFLTVSSRLEDKKLLEKIGGRSCLTEMINSVPTASHIMNYAQIIRRKSILRGLILASQEIGEIASTKEEEDIQVILDKAEKSIFSIAQKSLKQRFIPVKEDLTTAFERLDALSRAGDGLRGLPTGFTELDNKLAGLQKADLIILASRPSMGKSSFSMNMALNIASTTKVPVGIFSLEMSRDQIVDRFIATQARVDLWKMRTGRLSEKDGDFSRIQESLGVLAEAPVYIDDTFTLNVLQMKAMARRLQAQHGLGLLIIDYLQLMDPTNSNAPMVQQMTEISRALKGLAKELNIPVIALSQLSRAVEQRSPQIPRLSDLRESGCLSGDTLIIRADTGERISIKDLVGQKNIPVHALDENLKIKQVNISKIFSSGIKKIYELKTKSGYTIKASANHPFKKVDGWHRVDKLSVGDFIATPRKISLSSPKDDLSSEEIILLAHLLGDGCVLPRQPIHYTNGDYENIKIVAESAQKIFSIVPRIVKQKNWWHVYLPSPYRLARGKHNPIINWYSDLGLSPVRSWMKEIPEKIFSLSEKNICFFLRHLWATDGNISNRFLKDRKPSASIYYATTSLKMAQGVKHLLLMIGIRSKILEGRKKGYRVCYSITIQGKEDQLRFLKNIGSYGERGKIVPELIKKLNLILSNPNADVIPKEIWKDISITRSDYNMSYRNWAKNYGMSYCGSTLLRSGVSRVRLAKIVNFMPSAKLKNLVDSDIFWDEIISITPLGIEEVYDATVPGLHNFVANDIIVHNSIEQDADVVLFIYREDRYNERTQRKNIADIIIAKHRNGPVGKIELYFDENRATFCNLDKMYKTDEVADSYSSEYKTEADFEENKKKDQQGIF